MMQSFFGGGGDSGGDSGGSGWMAAAAAPAVMACPATRTAAVDGAAAGSAARAPSATPTNRETSSQPSERGSNGGGGGGGCNHGSDRHGSNPLDGDEERPPETVPKPPCALCSTTRIDEQLWQAFKVCVCYHCKRANEDRFGCVTKTVAKDEYLLPDSVLSGLACLEKDNPRKDSWGTMKLFLREQLAEVACLRWGGVAGLEAERQRRRAEKFERDAQRLSGAKKGPAKGKGKSRAKGAKGRRGGAGAGGEDGDGEAPAKRQRLAVDEDHSHSFDVQEEVDSETQLWRKTCKCGFSVEFRRL
jgi:hypothetical protein